MNFWYQYFIFSNASIFELYFSVLIGTDDHLLYIGGWKRRGQRKKNFLSSVEFKSINNNKTCHIQSLDYALAYHASVVTPIGVITCGGRTPDLKIRNDCFHLTNRNTWEPFPSMNEGRESFDLFVVGDILVAYDPKGNTFERINWRNGDKWQMPVWTLNRPFYWSCVTKWDDENVLITGGRNRVSITCISLLRLLSCFIKFFL